MLEHMSHVHVTHAGTRVTCTKYIIVGLSHLSVSLKSDFAYQFRTNLEVLLIFTHPGLLSLQWSHVLAVSDRSNDEQNTCSSLCSGTSVSSCTIHQIVI